MPKAPITWNGELVRTEFVYPPIPIRSFDWAATLDNYDLTTWDADTPAVGPRTVIGEGRYEMQAVCDLIQRLWEDFT